MVITNVIMLTTLFEVDEVTQELECTEHSLMEVNDELASITSKNKVLLLLPEKCSFKSLKINAQH